MDSVMGVDHRVVSTISFNGGHARLSILGDRLFATSATKGGGFRFLRVQVVAWYDCLLRFFFVRVIVRSLWRSMRDGFNNIKGGERGNVIGVIISDFRGIQRRFLTRPFPFLMGVSVAAAKRVSALR